jgi:dihydroorotate dehydrogenase
MERILGAGYRGLLRPLLFRLDAELAHRLTLAALARVPALTPTADPPELAIEVCGLTFTNPLGLAAGMDKDARAITAWNALGFGFAEIGTVTPRPQSGNPRPRMWRLSTQRALINRLGFPSDGIASVAPRIARARDRRPRLRLALNLGPNKETPAEQVAQDYAALARGAAPLADFIVVNVSSPNTPGLRDFQAPERIRTIIETIRRASTPLPPIMLKIAPDLLPPMINDICDAATALGLDGIVATNTTLQRESVGVESALPGGLSGAPLTELARAVIKQVHRRTAGRIALIGVGGVSSAEDAYAHIQAGASLVELYTGLIYQGPGVVRTIKRGLVRLLARDGFRSISEAVGSAAGDRNS